MTCEIIGTRRVDMKEEGVHGWSIFAARDEDGVNGRLTEKLFIRDEMFRRDTGGLLPNPGDHMEFEFNSRGKVGKVLAIA